MSDKTYVFEQTPNQGVDVGTAALLTNGNNRGNGSFGISSVGDLIGLIIAAGIFGGGNGLFGGNGNNNAEREMILQAINRNGNDIATLASSFNCSTNQLNAAINGLANLIAQMQGTIGLSSQQIINAVQAGNSTIISQMCNCCCELKQIMTQGFASLGYATERQTCDIEKAIAASTERILEGQRAAEMRDMQDKLDALREKNSQKDNVINNYQQTQTFAAMLQNATAPLLAGLQKVQGDVDGIICKMPKTINVPYQEAQAIPNCLYYNLFGFPVGFNGNNNNSFF